jgi:biotin carboxyl carrier protein
MKLLATVGDTVHTIEIRRDGSATEVFLDEQRLDAEIRRVGSSPVFSLLVGGHPYELMIEPDGSAYQVTVDQHSYRVRVEDERGQRLRALLRGRSSASGPATIRAPMPGLIVRIEVAEGQKVNAGDGVVVVEAMKMENEIRSSISGVVKRVAVRERQPVEKDEVLIVLEADESS